MSHGTEPPVPPVPPGPPASAAAEGLTLLAAFLLSSARGLLNEPPGYGVARCADGARRTLELLDLCGGGPDPRLVRVRERLEETMCGPMSAADFPALLDRALDEVVSVIEEGGDREPGGLTGAG
ncbi:DUF6092 family protein [Streptomyces aidingensis]|uniref:Uncharacterized protein n=1 Tax=Streptomyces aidingensis TaxID=910347 RepID=A0A1I1S8J6_9ACTN|nr:DUF6092 family protein [Streptomyces aidingensis]SFD40938.1 hypothetical protein SAMN05421773_114161 [Streptomyces aidingensis]